ncbi:MAG: sulfotransferase [Caulobacterales bacterium]|nr:sulfotransferase [Caulobacterales bacterium]
MHPLSGADLPTFLAASARGGGVPVRHWPTYAAIVGSIIGRAPFSAIERARMAGALPAAQDMEPPVFILGHWRSGTTHLYNVMAKAGFGFVPPVATGLPWDLMGLGTWLRPLLDKALPEHRWIDNVAVTPDAPQEDEIALANMTTVSFYHGIYFPSRIREFVDEGVFFDGLSQAKIAEWEERFTYLMRKLSLHQGGKRLLIKNPVYTARVARLRAIFPGAKFIHIRRSPFQVFASMRNFYRKLLPPLALQPFDDVDIDEIVLSVYERMMALYERDAAALPPGSLVDLAYEELDREPLAALERIYAGLALPGFEDARPIFAAYLESVRSYKKNVFQQTEDDAAKVEARWGRWVREWGYGRPSPP